VSLDVDPLRSGDGVSVGIRDGGRTVVTVTEGAGVRRWTVDSERLLEHACALAGRNLTSEEWHQALPDRPYERTCPDHPEG